MGNISSYEAEPTIVDAPKQIEENADIDKALEQFDVVENAHTELQKKYEDFFVEYKFCFKIFFSKHAILD